VKRTEALSIREIIDATLRREDIRAEALAHRAAWLWGEVVGPGVNRYTTRRYVADGVLHVYISASSLKEELGYMRRTIVEHINSALGAEVVRELKIH